MNEKLRPSDMHIPEAVFRAHGFTEADLCGTHCDLNGRAYVPVLRFRPFIAKITK